MKYAWIKRHQSDYGVRPLCRFMGVSSSGYYDWLKQRHCARHQENQRLTERLQVLFEQSRGLYGTRRLKCLLANQGDNISRRRIGRLMAQAGLCCRTKRKFKVTTDSKHTHPIALNHLNRVFTVDQPDRYYVGDITYLWTTQGWLYLAVVVDLFSRRVVGWSIKQHMRASLVNDALMMAIWRRKPKAGLLCHTDRGSQYASKEHRQLLVQHQIIQSMSRKGNCWDNSVSESFFHTLKTELIYQQSWSTREEMKQAIFEYIEVFYNRQRLHSANDYLSPVDYELSKKIA